MAQCRRGGRVSSGKPSDLARRHQILGDVRGRGLMIGRNWSAIAGRRSTLSPERDALVMAAFRRGLLVLAAGVSAIRLSPPLVVTTDPGSRPR